MKATVKKYLDKSARKTPYVRGLHQQLDAYKTELETYKTVFAPGHFYSPLPNIKELRKREKQAFSFEKKLLPAIDLNEESQLAMIDTLASYYPDLPFTDDKQPGFRYYFANSQFGHGDAYALYAMIRHLKPKRIYEIGSGFSSAVTLDTNERFFANSIHCLFIEPFPERLLGTFKPSDKKESLLIKKKLQDIDFAIFSELAANDILFIDSTHIAKADSDVNHIFFSILPRLKPGVVVHIHDVFYPFEYPKEWIYQGIFFNEDYLLRAFLEYNTAFEIIYFNSYLMTFFRDKMVKAMPVYAKNPGGSLWLRKVQ